MTYDGSRQRLYVDGTAGRFGSRGPVRSPPARAPLTHRAQRGLGRGVRRAGRRRARLQPGADRPARSRPTATRRSASTTPTPPPPTPGPGAPRTASTRRPGPRPPTTRPLTPRRRLVGRHARSRGLNGRALDFDGVNDRVVAPDAPQLRADRGHDPVRLGQAGLAATGWRTVLLKETGPSSPMRSTSAADPYDGGSPGEPCRLCRRAMGVRGTGEPARPVRGRTWRMTYDGADERLYANGVLMASRHISSNARHSTSAPAEHRRQRPVGRVVRRRDRRGPDLRHGADPAPRSWPTRTVPRPPPPPPCAPPRRCRWRPAPVPPRPRRPSGGRRCGSPRSVGPSGARSASAALARSRSRCCVASGQRSAAGAASTGATSTTATGTSPTGIAEPQRSLRLPRRAHLQRHPAHRAQAPGQLHRGRARLGRGPGPRRARHLLHGRPARHTVPYDPAELRRYVYDTTALLMASGLDPERCVLFRQSDVHEHTELTLAAVVGHRPRRPEPDDPVQGEVRPAARAGVGGAVPVPDAPGRRRAGLPRARGAGGRGPAPAHRADARRGHPLQRHLRRHAGGARAPHPGGGRADHGPAGPHVEDEHHRLGGEGADLHRRRGEARSSRRSRARSPTPAARSGAAPARRASPT